MKLLLDQGTPSTACEHLERAGFEVVHASQIGMASATDEEILRKAVIDGRVIVTLDADFHSLVALSGSAVPSIIRIRIEGLRAEGFAELVGRIVEECKTELNMGALVSVDENRIRVRRLPIG